MPSIPKKILVRSNKQVPEDGLPPVIKSEGELDELLSRPTPETVKTLRKLEGDILILGVSGKIGPSLARLAKRAIDESGNTAKVIGASRFSAKGVKESLDAAGVETISCDLLEESSLDKVPDATNVIYMAGRKFGTKEGKPATWAINAYSPALVARRFKHLRIVIFSTGNVYPLVPVKSGGATEDTPPQPLGEYAQSCLGRERIFEYFCGKFGTKAIFLRLNYAVELRYGILLDVAQKVFSGVPIDLRTGYANVIWQGDVNNIALQALTLCENPPSILNVTGPETVSIRWLANQFGEIFNGQPIFENECEDTALLSNAAKCHGVLGYPKVDLGRMIRWVAHWVSTGGPTLDKPTHFEVRDGRF